MPKFEKPVFVNDEHVETITLFVNEEGAHITFLDVKRNQKLNVGFNHETANVVYDLLAMVYPTREGDTYH